jgi:transcriptional regulator with XRE-family HTH domain
MTTPDAGTPVGPLLAAARARLGWTLRTAERAAGVTNAHISQIETGAIKDPGVAVLAKLAKAYGIPVWRLIEAAVPGANWPLVSQGELVAEEEETTVARLLAHRIALMEAVERVDAALRAMNATPVRHRQPYDRPWGTYDAIRRYAAATEGDLAVAGFLASPFAARWRTTTKPAARPRAASHGFARLVETGFLVVVRPGKPVVYRRYADEGGGEA